MVAGKYINYHIRFTITNLRLIFVYISFLLIYILSFSTTANAACELYIDRVVVGDCEYGPRTGNRSKVIVAVFLRWVMPPPGTNIVVRLKGQTKNFDPFDRGCPPYVQFILDPDGSMQTITAGFNLSSNCNAKPVDIVLPQACDPPVCAGANTIGGKVFLDYNNNGNQDLSEIGLPDVPINVFDDSKQIIGSTTTKTNGIWSIPNLTAGQKLRVEFGVKSKLYDAYVGSIQVEVNEENVRQLFIDLIFTEIVTPSTSQLAQLTEIANLCPFEDGNLVFWSRAILDIFNFTEVYNDNLTCNETNNQLNKKLMVNSSASITNITNENNILSIDFSVNNEDCLEINILSTNGNIVHNSVIGNSINRSINTSQWPVGLYFCVISKNNSIVDRKSISIIR